MRWISFPMTMPLAMATADAEEFQAAPRCPLPWASSMAFLILVEQVYDRNTLQNERQVAYRAEARLDAANHRPL